jgi:hypothetical protein
VFTFTPTGPTPVWAIYHFRRGYIRSFPISCPLFIVCLSHSSSRSRMVVSYSMYGLQSVVVYDESKCRLLDGKCKSYRDHSIFVLHLLHLRQYFNPVRSPTFILYFCRPNLIFCSSSISFYPSSPRCSEPSRSELILISMRVQLYEPCCIANICRCVSCATFESTTPLYNHSWELMSAMMLNPSQTHRTLKGWGSVRPARALSGIARAGSSAVLGV